MDDESLMKEINKVIAAYAKIARKPMTILAEVQAYLEELEEKREESFWKHKDLASVAGG